MKTDAVQQSATGRSLIFGGCKVEDTPGLGKTRMEALSDSIFAFAMTLLVIDIKVPEKDFADLSGNWPHLFVFVVSFVNLGLYWIAHTNEVKQVKDEKDTEMRTSIRWVMCINLFFLMLVVLVPFSTSLVGKYYQKPGAIWIYAGNLIAVGLSLQWLWVYAHRKQLMLPPNDFAYIRRGVKRNFFPPVCYAIAIVVSFWPHGLWISLVICLLTPIAYLGYVELTNRQLKAAHQ